MGAIVTLLSDFGTQDGYAGAMKGVILARAPQAQVVDLTHEIPPQDVAAGAWALREAAPMFPPGTIHVAVVDPGVGTQRRPLLIEGRGMCFVGPDNGLLTLAAPEGRGYVLDRAERFREQVSATFHGRDVFAAVAGHLAAGVLPSACGSPVETWVRIEQPQPRVDAQGITGLVVHVDRFGNLVTNLRREHVASGGAWQVLLAGERLGPVQSTYADVPPGQLVAYVGSSEAIEIGVRDGRAASEQLGRGALVRLERCAR